MDAVSLDIIENLDAALPNTWTRRDNVLLLPDATEPGMMIANVSVNDGTVTVTEFDGWTIDGQYVFSGSVATTGPRVLALLEALTTARAPQPAKHTRALTIPELRALPIGSEISVRGAGGRETMTRTASGYAGTGIHIAEVDMFSLTAWDARHA